MTKIIEIMGGVKEIKSCTKCNNKQKMICGIFTYCTKADGLNVINIIDRYVNSHSIPSWCPLPDKEGE